MRLQRLNILAHAERDELNRQLKYVVEAGFICPRQSGFGSPILWCGKPMARFDCALTTVALKRLRVTMLSNFRVRRTHSMSRRTRVFTPILQIRAREEEVHKTTFKTAGGRIERVAMPFGLCNTLAMFWRMMNSIMHDFS
jgi:hypothetical protein